MKPTIGIICRRSFQGKNETITLQQDYFKAVIKSGGYPILIPIYEDDVLLKEHLSRIQGLVIPGGIDVDPNFYHQEKHPLCGSIDEGMDEFELKVIHLAKEMKLPILAICRGIQVLNVAYGGTLFQDLSLYQGYKQDIIHAQDQVNIPKQEAVHSIEIVAGTKLHQLYGESLNVNSFHHQALDRVADGLVVTATSEEGVIEAVEGTSDHYVVGVQWHPEKMIDLAHEQLLIFDQFINACR
jgi:putative glutamine amidotransferase